MSENVLKASSTFRERKESFDKITSREIQKKFPLPFEGGGRDKERKKERKIFGGRCRRPAKRKKD